MQLKFIIVGLFSGNSTFEIDLSNYLKDDQPGRCSNKPRRVEKYKGTDWRLNGQAIEHVSSSDQSVASTDHCSSGQLMDFISAKRTVELIGHYSSGQAMGYGFDQCQ